MRTKVGPGIRLPLRLDLGARSVFFYAENRVSRIFGGSSSPDDAPALSIRHVPGARPSSHRAGLSRLFGLFS